MTRGNGQENNGELRITAEKLYDHANARSRYARKIKLFGDQTTLKNINALKELLTPYCGTNDANLIGHTKTTVLFLLSIVIKQLSANLS